MGPDGKFISPGSNFAKFSKFLDEISNNNKITDLVLLGDFIDMWRRDISGLFIEFHEIVEKIIDLKSTMNVYCIAGNHDYHLIKLTADNSLFKSLYPLQFLPSLDLPSQNPKYIFRHGWEFDPLQQKDLMEILCHNLSDTNGQIRSEIWNALTNSIKNDAIDDVKKIFGRFEKKDYYLSKILLPPEQRLGTENFGLVEDNAYNYKKDNMTSDQILVFGHTHRPFVDKESNVVNAGSWVSDATISNTYVVIDGDDVHLIQYEVGDITEKVECPKKK